MSEQKKEYRIPFRQSYPDLEDAINELATEGYEVVSYGPATQDAYPSVVMRLRLDVEGMPRLDELLALAEQVRNERVDLEARLKALEDMETRTFIDHLECRAKALEAALSRYQDTHATTHQYLDARKVVSQDVMSRLTEAERRIESVDSTMADAVLARLAEIERRLAAVEGAAMFSTSGGVWRKSDAD